jgi:hypothetical protein
MSDPQNAILKMLYDNETRLAQTETKEVPIHATGTWTPAFAGTTIAGTFTYGATTAGDWTRVGNMVFLRGRITLTAVAVAATGNLTITGLPFTSAAGLTSGTAGSFVAVYWGSVVLTAGKTDRGGWIQSNTSVIKLTESGNNIAAAFMPGGNINAATDLPFTASYQV